MVEFDDLIGKSSQYPSMALAGIAYAALASLMNTIDQTQIHPRFSTSFDKKYIESLGETAGILLNFVESYNGGGGSKEVEDLEGKIVSAAHAAEDAIESHVVDQILAESTKEDLQGGIAYISHAADEDIIKSHIVDRIPARELHLPTGICDLQKVTEDMNSIKENIKKVEKQGRFKDGQLVARSTLPPAASSRPGKTSMVGFDDYLVHLMDKLTGQPSHQLVILPIIGMGGVGKTTLARNLFENLLIKQHFDVCVWATISQNYSATEVLLQLLSSQDQEALNELHELGEKLHRFLFDRRYLIVLDDMWSIEVWDDIKFFFPENNNGSRIVMTTRLLNVALHFNSSYHTVNLLDEDKSWNLFCQESFGEEGCPTELEEVGKKICENCRGLPLSIVVIGGFLRWSSKSREYWEGIARDTYSILSSGGDNQCLNILSLSYNHLPAHLKPCFLYMGVFAEDEVILVSRLIQLWVAEGFLRPNDAQTLEEVAEGYLKDLVDRNLVLGKKWGCNGKMRACNVHDLIRELCLSVAEKEFFFCAMKSVGTPRTITRERRIVIHERMSNQEVSLALGSASLVRSLICRGFMRLDFKLLRVRIFSEVYKTWYRDILEFDMRCVNLRCLDYPFGPEIRFRPLHIPTQVSLLWNLQTVRIKGCREKVITPSELWEMVHLRHLQVDHLYVPDPPRNDKVNLALPNLQTLGSAMNFPLSEEVCRRIPNVKRLRLEYSEVPPGCDGGPYYCLQNLDRFHKLESLTLRFAFLISWPHMMLNMTFPTSLEKLTLYGGDLNWEDLEMIGSLPNLEVLKLREFAMQGSEWNPVEGGFRCLKFLQIQHCSDLTKWNADQFHFPVLKKLVLEYMRDLEEMPSSIGDIPTLQIISLFDCSMACALSAVKILEEQESLGNEDLQLEVGFIADAKFMSFREMVEEEGLTSNNLHIKNADSYFSFWEKYY